MFIGIYFILQITPAHDPNDFEVGKRHNLEFINIFTDDGKINGNGGNQFVGMPRFKARQAVNEALKEKVCHFNFLIQSLCFDLKLPSMWWCRSSVSSTFRRMTFT